jgi:hypothetical protein
MTTQKIQLDLEIEKAEHLDKKADKKNLESGSER